MSGKPNILLALSDDQSWRAAGAYGHPSIRTPAFDRIAREGVLFERAYCAAPQCSPSRAALLTGLNIWQLEEAGTQSSLFPAKFTVYPDLLEAAGYVAGYTGKPWGPGSWEDGGWRHNPAGAEFNARRLIPPTRDISNCDYAANFRDFLDSRRDGQPFCFWFGCHEPHRNYEYGSGVRAGKNPGDCEPPGFLPDVETVRWDLLDYELEVEWFDSQLGLMIQLLEERGELENTLIAVSSDNGMPFPRAKANLYEYGSHVPLALRWGERLALGQVEERPTSLIDLAPTFLEAAGLPVPGQMTGRSLLPMLKTKEGGGGRGRGGAEAVLTGKERHNPARRDNLGYPCRAIRTREFLYILNLAPERWPLGDPPGYYCHTTMINPSKEYILEHREEPAIAPFFRRTYEKRFEEELYDVERDLACLNNLASNPEYREIVRSLRERLVETLTAQKDPRMLGYGDIFESYPHYQRPKMDFGGFLACGDYNPEYWERAVRAAPWPIARNKVEKRDEAK